MLRRLDLEGPLLSPRHWEMRTIRSLLERGLVKPRPPSRVGRETAGLWHLSARGLRILPRPPAGGGTAEVRDSP